MLWYRHAEECMGSCSECCSRVLYLLCFSYQNNAVESELTWGELGLKFYLAGTEFLWMGWASSLLVCLVCRQRQKKGLYKLFIEDVLLPLLVIWGHEGIRLALG